MAIGDVWEFRLKAHYIQQECLNVFHYREVTAIAGSVTAEDLGNWLWTVIDTPLKSILVDDVDFYAIDVAQVIGGFDIGTFVITGGSGTLSGDILPSFVGYGFRYNRASSASRHGYKRFPGVAESSLDGNTVTLTSGLFDDVCEALAGNILDPALTEAGELEPVILSRVLNGEPRIPPVPYPVGSVVFTGVTTQNTRKP